MSSGEWTWSESAECPHSFNCPDGLESFDIGTEPSYVSIASSTLSCLGSLLIVITYCLLKDMRSGAQTVITMLAIADFFTAFGYIIGSVNFLVNYTDHQRYDCTVFTAICEIQSFITTWSTMSSYCWTCILAFYFFLVLVYNNKPLASCLIPFYNIVAWVAPLLIVLPLLVENKLGYAPYVASNWCYIKDMNYTTQLSEKLDTIAYILVAGKLWEIMCYVFIIILYSWIKISFEKTKRRLQAQHEEGTESETLPKIVRVEKRLLAIPVLYIFLRIWGTSQFFYSLIVADQNKQGCIPPPVKTVYIIFGVLQAIGDGGQGWCNAILYIFLSPTIRRKLCGAPCENCLRATERKFQKMLEETNPSDQNEVDRAVVSEIIDRQSHHEGIADSVMNRAVDATGYKIRKYDSNSGTQSSRPGFDAAQLSSRGLSASNKINN